jgi:predicted transposase YbfD/YdcC
MGHGPAWCWRKRGVRADAHEGELTVAPALLAALPLAGRVVTGDAQYCQRSVCTQVIAAGGAYVFIVKDNQPELLDEIRLLFDWAPPGEVFAHAEQYGQRGDRWERRRLWASPALQDYLDWPGIGMVCKLERLCRQHGQTQQQGRYVVTSLSPTTSARALLRYARGHWGIENRLHYVRDVSFGEDASQVRSGAAPEILAALRNAVIALVRQTGAQNVASALRQYGWRPGASLRLLGITP